MITAGRLPLWLIIVGSVGCLDPSWTPPDFVGGQSPDGGQPIDGSVDGGVVDARLDGRADMLLEAPDAATCDDGSDTPPCNGCPVDSIVPAGFVCIPDGDYVMGSPIREFGRNYHHREGLEHEEQHAVTITRPFLMQQHETSQAEWRAFTETGGERSPSFFYSNELLLPPPLPVESINWFEALHLANERSRAEGLETCYRLEGCTGEIGSGCGPGDLACEAETFVCTTVEWPRGQACEGYRLPTEAEWEYAARAGTTTAYWWGENTNVARESHDVGAMNAVCFGTRPADGAPCPADPALSNRAVYCCNSHQLDGPALGHPATLGHRSANPWGLEDMLGNVDEWVWDSYADDYGGLGPVSDPTGPDLLPQDGSRVSRGGSFYNSPPDLRAAFRWSAPAVRRDFDTGVRLVRTLPQ